jgi:hypothetical protein
MSTQPAPAQNAQFTTQYTPRPAHPSSHWRSYLPLFVILAYTAFLVTGFGTGLGTLQPLPVYAFICLVLLTLQESIAADRSFAHFLYISISAIFAVLYAGAVMFGTRALDFTRNPLTYFVLNAVLFVVFVADVTSRRVQRSRKARAVADGEPTGLTAASYGATAADFGAAAVFFLVSALLLDLLGNQFVLQRLGVTIGHPPYVVVDLNQLFHLNLRAPVNLLEGMDLVLGLAATAGASVFLVVAGVLLPSGDEAGASNAPLFPSVVRVALSQALYGLRLVLTPLIWLIPAFSVAFFAQQVTRYFNLAAKTPGSWLELLNPFSPTSRANLELGLSTFAFGLVAWCAMLVAVALMEQDHTVVPRALRMYLALGRSIALTLAFFMYTLTLVNVVVVLLGITEAKPFQVGLPSLLALLIGILWLIYESASDRSRASNPRRPSVAPVESPATRQPVPGVIPVNSPPADGL